MRRLFALLAGVLLVGACALPASAATPDYGKEDTGGKGDKGFTITDPRITESSGLAASRQHPGIYWTHNDSDDGPYLYAVDSATGSKRRPPVVVRSTRKPDGCAARGATVAGIR